MKQQISLRTSLQNGLSSISQHYFTHKFEDYKESTSTKKMQAINNHEKNKKISILQTCPLIGQINSQKSMRLECEKTKTQFFNKKKIDLGIQKNRITKIQSLRNTTCNFLLSLENKQKDKNKISFKIHELSQNQEKQPQNKINNLNHKKKIIQFQKKDDTELSSTASTNHIQHQYNSNNIQNIYKIKTKKSDLNSQSININTSSPLLNNPEQKKYNSFQNKSQKFADLLLKIKKIQTQIGIEKLHNKFILQTTKSAQKLNSNKDKKQNLYFLRPKKQLHYNQINFNKFNQTFNQTSSKDISLNTGNHNQHKKFSRKISLDSIFHKNIKQEISIDDFKILQKKGEGRFGTVYCVIHKWTSTIYAIKKIKKCMIKNADIQMQLLFQIKLQLYLNNPNILKLYAIFSDKQHIYLLLQYMEQGTLFQYIKQKQNHIDESEIAKIITQIAISVKYIHDLHIIHRDIKPQNIVISHNTYKLCDFGWAAKCTNRRKTFCGTLDYSAPQIFQGKQYNQCVDIWCLGVLTYQLLVGLPPFYNNSRKQTINQIINFDKNTLQFPEYSSQDIKNFIQSLLKKDPNQRIKASQIFQHNFLLKYAQQNQQ